MRVTCRSSIIPHYLESTASVREHAIALLDGDNCITYSQLRAAAFELAIKLKQHFLNDIKIAAIQL